MIPETQNIEEIKSIQRRDSDTILTIQQIVQNLEQESNIRKLPKSLLEQQNQCIFDIKETDQDFKNRQFSVGLKKQQSDNSSDYKNNQVKSFSKRSCRTLEINSQKKIELSSIMEIQQIPNFQQENQFKNKNEEQQNLVEIDNSNDDLEEIICQIQQIDNDLENRRQNIQKFNSFKKQTSHESVQQQENKNNKEDSCPICGIIDVIRIQLLSCEHKFCLNCYKEYLEDKIKNAKINNIPCLEEGCIVKFPEPVIKETVSKQKFDQYLIFKRKLEIENDMNKKWCPAVGCDLYVERNPKSNIVQCHCGTSICFNCGRKAHLGQLCEQAIEEDFRDAINKYSIKYCPGCNAHIQKNAGCNHMTCIQCHYQYCWVCLQHYNQYHYRYWSLKGCAIWSNGRFKTNKIVSNPDRMRWIFFLPRLILFLLRGPLIFFKFLFFASVKSFSKPFQKLNKKISRSRKPKSCFLRSIYFIFVEIIILIIVIIIFPFYLLFYRIFKEFKWLCIKGCAY
ncbi:unnamed protein product [Paramecium sonneborni]|uniref:RBR-type E3 ubiquitin transferase n=1 Tax=Paramecium sonneborni TaxID=65129 RepID=A0A8S1R127_9CILI|nr:unnamed protein product [Paramecium sonneborni]